jgi:Uma2 family endonuclease
MSQTTEQRTRWTTADLDLLPDSSDRYEIIDGELLVTKAPHWKHQKTLVKICSLLNIWSEATGLGEVVQAPGIIFSDADNFIPDAVWISHERLAAALDGAGHLTISPELIIEVLSAGAENERRDREIKLNLYANQGVLDYWILDWRSQQVEIYRSQSGTLQLVSTLSLGDHLTSPLLPNFSCEVERLFR